MVTYINIYAYMLLFENKALGCRAYSFWHVASACHLTMLRTHKPVGLRTDHPAASISKERQ